MNMKPDDRIDRVLSELPAWEPSAHFARRVVTIAESEYHPQTIPRLFWFRAALQGAALTGIAMVGGAVVSSAARSVTLIVGMVLETYAHSLSLFHP
jgi:hypothetical protein